MTGREHSKPQRDAIGSTASMAASTFELRTRGSAGETWEPAVILAGSAVGTISPPEQRTGLAVVSASPIHGPSSRLAPDGDAWALLPAGIRLTPVGLTPDDIGAVAELVTVVEPGPVPEPRTEPESQLDRGALRDDHTIVTVPRRRPRGTPGGRRGHRRRRHADLVRTTSFDTSSVPASAAELSPVPAARPAARPGRRRRCRGPFGDVRTFQDP